MFTPPHRFSDFIWPMSTRPASRSTQATKRARSTVAKKKPFRKPFKPLIVYLGRNPFPLQIQNTLVYNESVLFTVTLGAMQTWSFRANGMYDPNNTGTGHQPLYYDQLKEIYNHWVVIKSKATFRFTCPSTGDKSLQIATCVDDDTAIVVTNPAFVAERKGAKFSMWNPAAGNPAPVHVAYYNAAAMFAGDPLSDQNQQGLAGSDPLEQALFHVCISDADATSFNMQVNVQIEYDVVWSEIKSVSSS